MNGWQRLSLLPVGEEELRLSMTTPQKDAADFVIKTLTQRRRETADKLVNSLARRFSLDAESAGDVIWRLIDEHKVRVTEEAQLALDDAG